MTDYEIFLTVLISLFVALMISLISYLTFKSIRFFYKKWIVKNSGAIKSISSINNKFKFQNIKNRELSVKYDADHNYDNVSPEDYLIYQLVFLKKQVINDIKVAAENAKLYRSYKEEIERCCKLTDFSEHKGIVFKKYAQKIEKKEINRYELKPTCAVSIDVCISRINMYKYVFEEKTQRFETDHILALIKRINNKTGRYYGVGFYQDKDIWDAICRVERAKVSNAMRFRIYERDENRCCKCGKMSGNLEIDHIIPIAKGGKSNYDNLQTLCHECNVNKGDKIE